MFADFYGNGQLYIIQEVWDCLWAFEILEEYKLQIEKMTVGLALTCGPIKTTLCIQYSSFNIKSIIGLLTYQLEIYI